MVSHDFIGLLMLGLFNVSIGRQKIRADLSHDAIVGNPFLYGCHHAIAPSLPQLLCYSTATAHTPSVPCSLDCLRSHAFDHDRRNAGEVRSMTSIAFH